MKKEIRTKHSKTINSPWYTYSSLLICSLACFANIGSVLATNFKSPHAKSLLEDVRDNKNKFSQINGKIINEKTGSPISFATIIFGDNQGAVAGEDGHFVIQGVGEGKYRVRVSCLGFQSIDKVMEIHPNSSIVIKLSPLSMELKGVEVMADYKNRRGIAHIGQEALKYIQPTSLGDIFLLLPGNLVQSNGLSSFKGFSSRQIGSDDNTSLGLNLSINGAPVSNDGLRLQMSSITGIGKDNRYAADYSVSSRNATNSGVDLRSISTDHIESVDVERGISSASEGNLSSASIKIHSKQGRSPWEIRLKADPLNKLAYVGKGFSFGKKLGTLHIGLDGLIFKPDVREPLQSYVRTTAQATYNNQLRFHNGIIWDFISTLSFGSSLQDDKSDELTREYQEKYRQSYNRVMESLTGSLRFTHHKIVDRLDYILSLDYTYDHLYRKKHYIATQAPASMPTATTPGEHAGFYLPTAYDAIYDIDNKPLYFFSQAKLASWINQSDIFSQRLLYGVEYRIAKNFGDGVITNPQRPPYPSDNTFIRPRPNKDIPALTYGAGFVEDNLQMNFEKNTISVMLGLRSTTMLNLPSNFYLQGKLLWEPRLQLSYSYGEKDPTGFNIRLGYGKENKLPTLDYLYPDKIYRDFAVMNAYFSDKSPYNRLITYTYIHNPENPELKENANHKWEIGLDFHSNGYSVSLTGFREYSNSGFEYAEAYYPIGYDRYVKLKPGVSIHDREPQKNDYEIEHFKDFTTFPTVKNSLLTEKRGLEYRFRTPFIPKILTQIEINGAYYHTIYGSSVPIQFRPSVVEYNQLYPYVGFYGKGSYQHLRRFNTNIWFNTHIPRFKLFFTNFFQIVWYESKSIGHERSDYPYAYMDLDGKIHPVSKDEITSSEAQKGPLRYLNQERSEIFYRPTTKPVYLRMNFKATKEFGTIARISFFVDNIIDISPRYKVKNVLSAREWFIPKFGLETTISI